jgi:hypothetical protein
MATKGSTNPERIARWKLMWVGLKAYMAEYPLLAPLHTELEGVILQSEQMDARSEALKAEAREVNRLRTELAKKGDELRSRLGATLQTVHGFKSEKLIEFGITPRKSRGRDRQPRARRGGDQPPAPASTSVPLAVSADDLI